MNVYAWAALALVLLPAAVGWYICFRAVAGRYLERHEAKQVADAAAESTVAAINGHRSAFQRKRDLRALGSAERVTLTRSGPKAST